MEEIDVTGKTVMVIGAHPDDIEIIGGGTLAKASANGGKGVVVVVTNGDKGSEFGDYTHDELVKIREQEQRKACATLGVKDVEFLNIADCYTKADIHLKERLVYFIRKYRPHILITHNITVFRGTFVNHKDHRSTTEAVLDAYFPLAGNAMCFCEHFEEGLKPHSPELMMMITFLKDEINAFVDIEGFLQQKLNALVAHDSQLKNKEWFCSFVSELGKAGGNIVGREIAETFICLGLNPSSNSIEDLLKLTTVKIGKS